MTPCFKVLVGSCRKKLTRCLQVPEFKNGLRYASAWLGGDALGCNGQLTGGESWVGEAKL
jgi:hypothetical protein